MSHRDTNLGGESLGSFLFVKREEGNVHKVVLKTCTVCKSWLATHPPFPLPSESNQVFHPFSNQDGFGENDSYLFNVQEFPLDSFPLTRDPSDFVSTSDIKSYVGR